MSTPTHRSPAGLLLVVTAPASGAPTFLVAALEALPFLSRNGPRYAGYLPPDVDEPLRRLATACASGGTRIFVLAEHTAAAETSGPYRRLWDRTEDLAEALGAWKACDGSFPDLRPGDIVRL